MGEHALRPPNGIGLMVELNLGLEKSGKCQGISYYLESGNPVFSPLPYSRASNLGKVYANFSGEIVASSSALDHRAAAYHSRSILRIAKFFT